MHASFQGRKGHTTTEEMNAMNEREGQRDSESEI